MGISTKGDVTIRGQKKQKEKRHATYRCCWCWCATVNSRKGAFMWRGKWEWAGREKLEHDEQAGKGGVRNSQERHT